jgi:ubiquinone/menaquinone biosynthesis C-methylase UbiE
LSHGKTRKEWCERYRVSNKEAFIMAGTSIFDLNHQRYDQWFEHHLPAYQSELLAVRALLPWQGLGLSIGVGTGRFAAPLGVPIGLDPSAKMLEYASRRNISAIQAAAEALPFHDASFDYILCVTTICFVDDISLTLKEARRVLKAGGALVLGFIDRDTPLGQQYLEHQDENPFYREARFFSATEVEQLLEQTGFVERRWVQTLFNTLEETKQIEALRSGYGQGAFVSVRAYGPDE